MAASTTAIATLGSDADANDVGTALLSAPGGPGSPRSTGGESSSARRPPFDEITVRVDGKGEGEAGARQAVVACAPDRRERGARRGRQGALTKKREGATNAPRATPAPPVPPPPNFFQSGRPALGPRRAAARAALRSLARGVWAHWDKALVAALLATLVGMMAAHGGPATLTSLLAWFQARSGWGGWGAFLGVYTAVVALLLPAVWLVLGAGFVFGFWRGLLAVWVGGAIGQAAAFLLARYLLAGCLRPKNSTTSTTTTTTSPGRRRSIWQALDRAIAAEGWKLLALLRLCPLVPYNLLNLAAAATSLPFWAFALTSAVAIGPECALFTYTGSVAEGVTEIVSGGAHHGGGGGAGRWVGFGLTAVAATGTSVLATVFVRRAIARADAAAAAEAVEAAEEAAAGAGGLDPLDPEGLFAPPPLVLGGGSGGRWARIGSEEEGEGGRGRV